MIYLQKTKDLSSTDQIKAISDPYRIRILTEFTIIGKPATVKQIADKMGEVPAKVYYHVKKLVKAEILTLQHTEIINGIVAKFYEPTATSFNIKDHMTEKVYVNESEKLIHNMYAYSEEIFLEQIRNKNSSNFPGICSMENSLYLTESEAKEFEEYIINFMESHKACKNASKSEQVNTYHTFFTFIKSKEK